jgi:hypothetical protein
MRAREERETRLRGKMGQENFIKGQLYTQNLLSRQRDGLKE